MTTEEQKKYDHHAAEVTRIDAEIAELEKARAKNIEVMWALDGRTLYPKPEVDRVVSRL